VVIYRLDDPHLVISFRVISKLFQDNPSFPGQSKPIQANPRMSSNALEMPIASAIESLHEAVEAATTIESVEATEALTDVAALLTTLKSLETSDLFKVMKQAVAEAERKSRAAAKGSRAAAAKPAKKGSMPKGPVPQQLKKPRAWVDFVLSHARANGWEAFTVYQTKKNKITGETIEEIIEQPASIAHEGAYIYEGSITDKQPNGKQLIQKDAMSLSKQYWAPKEQKGTRPELYAEFEASYAEDEVSVPETASVASSKVIRMTAAEKDALAIAKKEAKEAEREEKKAAKEAEREAKKAEREAEKSAKKAEKEAEKEAKKAAKEAEKSAKKSAPKTAAAKPVAAKPVPAAAIAKPVAATAKPVAPAAAAPVAAVAPKPKPVAAPAPAADEWKCPADGMIHPWAYKGKNYFRNADNEVWAKAADGSCGDWQGVFLPAEGRIDDSVAEPQFADE